MLRRHILEISVSDTLRDVWRFEIPPHGHVFPAWKTFIFCIFLSFFLGIVPEITQPDSYKKLNKMKKIQIFNIF